MRIQRQLMGTGFGHKSRNPDSAIHAVRLDFRIIVGLFAALTLQACAVEVYDPATATTHIWGFGHLSASKHMSADGLTALVTDVESYGLTLAQGEDGLLLNLGARRSARTEILAQDSQLVLQWNDGDPHSLHPRRMWHPSTEPTGQEVPSP